MDIELGRDTYCGKYVFPPCRLWLLGCWTAWCEEIAFYRIRHSYVTGRRNDAREEGWRSRRKFKGEMLVLRVSSPGDQ